MGRPTNTDSTSIHLEDGKYILTGEGGYDGFARNTYDSVEDAIIQLADWWGVSIYL